MILNHHGINAQDNGLAPDEVLIGGRIYHIVTIGSQVWLVENLQYIFDGLSVSTADAPISGSPTTPTAWYYDNDAATYGLDGPKPCGLLYNWAAVDYLEQNKADLCPGWHVPTSDEWTTLTNTLGGLTHADELKAADNAFGTWPTSWNGTNSTGFSAVPGGRYWNSTFAELDTYGRYWTATQDSDTTKAIERRFNNTATLGSYIGVKVNGLSLRLVKDV